MPSDYHHLQTGPDIHPSKIDPTTGTELTVSSQSTYDTRWKAPVDAHVANTANPHATTAAQVGLANVPNVNATNRASHTGTQTAATISDFQTSVSANTSVSASVTHAGRTDNPHAVTAAQVGSPPVSTTIATTTPLTVGGDLSANRTLAIPAATNSVDGYLRSTDWASFNAKQPRAFTTVGPAGSTGNDYTCTGTADNTVFQTAINLGLNVKVRRGTYSFADIVNVQASGLWIDGDGIGETIIQLNFEAYGATPQQRAAFVFIKGNGTADVSNIQVSNLTIDHSQNSTSGLIVYANGANQTYKNYYFHDIEFKNRKRDGSGGMGNIVLSADKSGVLGKLQDVTIERCDFHDTRAFTSSSGNNTYCICVQSNSLENLTIEDCKFRGIDGSSISKSSTVAQGNKNWVIDRCLFKGNKVLATTVPASAFVDISDGTRDGFRSIKVTNCRFDDSDMTFATDNQSFHMAIYNSREFIVDHNTFYKSRAVIAPGHSFPAGNESQAWLFSNNTIDGAQNFSDFDGHYCGMYDGNVFRNIVSGGFLGGYGHHGPSVYQNNFFYNCVLNPNITEEYYQGIFEIEDGGNVVQNNFFYDDTPSSKLKYVICETSGGGYTGYTSLPNIFKGNTFMLTSATTRVFYIDSDYVHVFQNNTGLRESSIVNSLAHAVISSSPLAPSDVESQNYKADGAPVSSPQNFVIVKTASSTLTLAEQQKTIKADATAGTVTLTLPDAATVSFGYRVKRINSGSNSVVLATASSQTLDGASTKTLGSQWAMIEVASDGVNWQLVDQMGTVT